MLYQAALNSFKITREPNSLIEQGLRIAHRIAALEIGSNSSAFQLHLCLEPACLPFSLEHVQFQSVPSGATEKCCQNMPVRYSLETVNHPSIRGCRMSLLRHIFSLRLSIHFLHPSVDFHISSMLAQSYCELCCGDAGKRNAIRCSQKYSGSFLHISERTQI